MLIKVKKDSIFNKKVYRIFNTSMYYRQFKICLATFSDNNLKVKK